MIFNRRRRLSRIGPLGLFRSRIYFLKLMNLLDSCRTPWTSDRSETRPLPTQNNTTQQNAYTYPCL